MNQYQQRLYNEWIQHGKIIIAADFDSTISYWPTIENRDDIMLAQKVLKLCQEVGCYMVVNTACNPDRYPEIRYHCAAINLQINGINKTPVELPYGKHGKVYANVYIDDRTIAFRESLLQLEEVAYRVRAYNAGRKVTEQTVEF